VKWFFTVEHDGNVHLQARFDGPGGMIGDVREVVRHGQEFKNLTYAQLLQAGAGMIEEAPNGLLMIHAPSSS
jgi:hypothetical protein